MAHIPMDDIEQLWGQTKQHSWSALHDTLEQHRGKAEGISDNLVDMMLQITSKMEQSHRGYPDSAQRLYDELNQQLQASGAK